LGTGSGDGGVVRQGDLLVRAADVGGPFVEWFLDGVGLGTKSGDLEQEVAEEKLDKAR